MNRTSISALTILFLSLFLPGRSFGQHVCSVEEIPLDVRNLLKQKFPGWAIVTVSDLRSDDQQIWRRAHPRACPGYTVGNFRDADHLSYAFNLFRKDREHTLETLFVIDSDEQGQKLRVLSEPTKVAYLSVTSKPPPGKYGSADGTKRITAPFSVISYEAIESGELLYYWSNGRYHSVLTSD
jgi:hypothetical protein